MAKKKTQRDEKDGIGKDESQRNIKTFMARKRKASGEDVISLLSDGESDAAGEASGMAVALDRRQDGRWTDADNRSDSSFLAQPAIARAALNGKLTNLNQLTAGPALERLQSEKSATQHSYETSDSESRVSEASEDSYRPGRGHAEANLARKPKKTLTNAESASANPARRNSGGEKKPKGPNRRARNGGSVSMPPAELHMESRAASGSPQCATPPKMRKSGKPRGKDSKLQDKIASSPVMDASAALRESQEARQKSGEASGLKTVTKKSHFFVTEKASQASEMLKTSLKCSRRSHEGAAAAEGQLASQQTDSAEPQALNGAPPLKGEHSKPFMKVQLAKSPFKNPEGRSGRGSPRKELDVKARADGGKAPNDNALTLTGVDHGLSTMQRLNGELRHSQPKELPSAPSEALQGGCQTSTANPSRCRPGAQQHNDETGNWNPGDSTERVSSQAEGGQSSAPSSNIVDIEDEQSSPESPLLPVRSADGAAAEPKKVGSWGSFNTGPNEPEDKADNEISSPGLMEPSEAMSKPDSHADKQAELPTTVKRCFGAKSELEALEACTDEELLRKLPQLEEPPESLSLMSRSGRKQKIQEALDKRDEPSEEPRVKGFKRQLLANMESNAEQKKSRKLQAASVIIPPKAKATQPARAKQKTEENVHCLDGNLDKARKDASIPRKGPLNMRVALWDPPPSPFTLIEEVLYKDPWKLLVACMLLNKTTGRAVRRILWKLFELAPTPEIAMNADPEAVEAVIYPLGLYKKRALMFKRFSREYLQKEWNDPQQLHGIGQYAADAYNLFCRNKWREMRAPQDKDLLKYYKWLKETNGEGHGYEREIFAMPSESASIEEPSKPVDICSPSVVSKPRAQLMGTAV